MFNMAMAALCVASVIFCLRMFFEIKERELKIKQWMIDQRELDKRHIDTLTEITAQMAKHLEKAGV